MGSKKKNLTDEELFAFVSAIEPRYNELFGRAKGVSFKESKEAAWGEVRAECLAQGFKSFEGKSVDSLRDDIYGYRRRAVEHKFNNSKKTGHGGIQWKNVSVFKLKKKLIKWEETIIRMEKFNEMVEVLDDIADSGGNLTDFQKTVRDSAVAEEEKNVKIEGVKVDVAADVKDGAKTPARSYIPQFIMRGKKRMKV